METKQFYIKLFVGMSDIIGLPILLANIDIKIVYLKISVSVFILLITFTLHAHMIH